MTENPMLVREIKEKSRMCPSLTDQEINHAPSDTKNQGSFSIQIIKCTDSSSSCKTDG